VLLSLERDVRELSRLRQGHLLEGLLERLAGQTAQVLNVEHAARTAGLDKATTDSYISLLEKVFLMHRLPAWGKTLTARSAASPKIHVVDSAIAARLLRLTPEKLSTLDPTAQTELGHLLETFAGGELLKQASWCADVSGVGHWRTHDHLEVDLLIELDDGGVFGFEVKSGSGPTRSKIAYTSCRSTVSGPGPHSQIEQRPVRKRSGAIVRSGSAVQARIARPIPAAPPMITERQSRPRTLDEAPHRRRHVGGPRGVSVVLQSVLSMRAPRLSAASWSPRWAWTRARVSRWSPMRAATAGRDRPAARSLT